MNQLFTYVINNLFTLKIIYLKKKKKKTYEAKQHFSKNKSVYFAWPNFGL